MSGSHFICHFKITVQADSVDPDQRSRSTLFLDFHFHVLQVSANVGRADLLCALLFLLSFLSYVKGCAAGKFD